MCGMTHAQYTSMIDITHNTAKIGSVVCKQLWLQGMSHQRCYHGNVSNIRQGCTLHLHLADHKIIGAKVFNWDRHITSLMFAGDIYVNPVDENHDIWRQIF